MKGCRKAPQNGDVFYMQLPAGMYLFGRVIVAEPPPEVAPGPMCNLIYIYNWKSLAPNPDYSQLQCNRLLISPVWTNRLGWTRGYFQHIENKPLGETDLLTGHCFFDAARRRYVDQSGKPVKERVEPCGIWALVSYRWIDDHVSDAVGLPRVPEQELR